MDSPNTGLAAVHILASPAAVYVLISDVTRMGEWSPEAQAGEWRDDATGPVEGPRFRGTNGRRLTWKTIATITATVAGADFAFAIGKNASASPETTWRYTLTAAGDGTDVSESFEIVRAPGALGKFLTKLGTGVAWNDRPADMVAGMRTTLENLKGSEGTG